ncbi:hypothetical protein L0F81_22335 [Streptomyces tricolor]|uniref:PucR family transcriptional regulator n=1 Tax=Streptomyces tricolor TaxID=68277 RepID=A0ABS9JKE7_9ACTN|nr:hypothetical protein [Streptomyces tricolor]MCG0066001.1 hypothetical protein [Streptomyces tricolor]
MSEPLYRPWGTVTPEFWTSPAPGVGTAPQGLAAETLRARLVKVAEVAQHGRMADAVTLAAQLDQDVTAEYGEAHLHTVQVREVRGYLAALMGEHATGLAWYLHAAQLRVTVQGPSHPDVEAATLRAYSLWRAMPDEDERRRLAGDLLTVVTDIHGTDSLLARRVRDRLYSLALPAPAE